MVPLRAGRGVPALTGGEFVRPHLADDLGGDHHGLRDGRGRLHDHSGRTRAAGCGAADGRQDPRQAKHALWGLFALRGLQRHPCLRGGHQPAPYGGHSGWLHRGPLGRSGRWPHRRDRPLPARGALRLVRRPGGDTRRDPGGSLSTVHQPQPYPRGRGSRLLHRTLRDGRRLSDPDLRARFHAGLAD